ncbi:MAG: DUF4328 domain-containing protein [Gemmatimonadales bacterium]|nr:DUF4328 domain-containing protein [Gemmatimonadales bacterium]NIN11251.1 DUF4328 domain-containing protein [Gemmatimonadales bacterium]NIN49850.1 DUF4328 domain-containing protein [Gemmatimonadales bacterium]NIP07314.1 DUF4328 domain-containing protein [Gemmatimonadales bacterium]NIR03009.1 DUF4328 domain-containing protein [Gemmatimonadales bacterium]
MLRSGGRSLLERPRTGPRLPPPDARPCLLPKPAVAPRHRAATRRGGFFVPILNLIIPYRVMREVWRGALPCTRQLRQTLSRITLARRRNA